MANVLFKHGLQANLDTIRSNLTAVEGTFYLTTDTHRLHVGRITDRKRANGAAQDATHCDAVPVNQGVNFVADINGLPTVTAATATQYVGQFYYVSNKNILCVYSNSAVTSDTNHGGWVQINPNTDTHVDGISFTVTTDATTNTATITTSISNVNAEGDAEDSISQSYSITGAGSVSVSGTGSALTITGDQYEIKTAADANKTNEVEVQLKSTSTKDDSSFSLVGGDHVTLTRENNGNVTIAAEYNEIQSVDFKTGNGAASNPSNEGFYVKVKDQSATKSDAINPIIAVGNDTNIAANQVKFIDGTATLPVYSKDDIDTMLKGLDAMTFRGVVSSEPAKTDIANGDTFKVSTGFDVTIDGETVTLQPGDLLIATGTETNGVITSNFKWQVVSSGDGDLVTYIGQAITHGLKITEVSGGVKGDNVGQLTLKEGTAISLTDTVNTSSNGNEITIAHANVTRNDPAAVNKLPEGQNVNDTVIVQAVTGVTTNAQGHVTGVTLGNWSLKDTNGSVGAVNADIATTSSTADTVTTYTSTVTTGVRSINSSGDESGYETGSYQLKSSSLQISSTPATISTSKKVTTQAVMTVDMVWGTF